MSYTERQTWTGITPPSIPPAAVVNDGDFDVEGSFVAATESLDTSFTAFVASTPDGELSVRRTAVYNAWWLKVRGVDVLHNDVVIVESARSLEWRAGDLVRWRAWYRPSTSECGLRVSVNGVYATDLVAAATGPGLAEPTSVTLGAGSMANRGQLQTFGAFTKSSLPVATTPEIVVLGDSTLGSFPYVAAQGPNTGKRAGLISIAHDIYTPLERTTRNGIGLIAVPGDTIAGQRAKFEASDWWDQTASVKAVIVQVGINDRVGGAATAAALLQNLLNAIRGQFGADVKILLGKLIPFARFESPAWTSFLLELNQDIAGTGPNPITGADAVVTAHYDVLNDGSGGLLEEYNFDLIHQNNAGRVVMAGVNRSPIEALGVLPPAHQVVSTP